VLCNRTTLVSAVVVTEPNEPILDRPYHSQLIDKKRQEAHNLMLEFTAKRDTVLLQPEAGKAKRKGEGEFHLY